MQTVAAGTKRRWRFPVVELTAIAVIALLLVACVVKGRGASAEKAPSGASG